MLSDTAFRVKHFFLFWFIAILFSAYKCIHVDVVKKINTL